MGCEAWTHQQFPFPKANKKHKKADTLVGYPKSFMGGSFVGFTAFSKHLSQVFGIEDGVIFYPHFLCCWAGRKPSTKHKKASEMKLRCITLHTHTHHTHKYIYKYIWYIYTALICIYTHTHIDIQIYIYIHMYAHIHITCTSLIFGTEVLWMP